ncbi:hypothetical protein SLS64_004827 [Diaporthe eres]
MFRDRRFGGKTPVTVRLGPAKAYLLTQTETYGPLLRATRSCTNKAFAVRIMKQMFGMPKSAIHIYQNDKSGIGVIPLPGSTVPPHLRVWQHQHKTATRFLQGDALKAHGTRFIEYLSAELSNCNLPGPVNAEAWVQIDDFYKWWTHRLFTAAITALCGPHLVRLNPTFVEDFWEYIDHTPTISKFYPRFLAPRAYRSRQRVLDAIKRWHVYARDHSDYRLNGPEDPDWDEYWGSKWLKVRQEWGQDSGEMDDDALASDDLAVITATSSNALPATFWNLIEIYNDQKLLGRVEHTLAESIVPSHGSTTAAETPPLRFDLTRTLSSPLLQSIYAEVLRQRVSLFHNRSPTVGDYKLGPFALRSGGLVCVSTDIAHNSEEAWGPARAGRPLGEFWAERFLAPAGIEKDEGGSEAATEARFSTEGLDGAWIPYGGGALMCPGRHLAKIKMLGSVAVFSAYFDMEVLNYVPCMNDAFFGMGSQPPGEPVPVRLRRKVGDVRVSASMRRNRAPSVWFSHEQYH